MSSWMGLYDKQEELLRSIPKLIIRRLCHLKQHHSRNSDSSLDISRHLPGQEQDQERDGMQGGRNWLKGVLSSCSLSDTLHTYWLHRHNLRSITICLFNWLKFRITDNPQKTTALVVPAVLVHSYIFVKCNPCLPIRVDDGDIHLIIIIIGIHPPVPFAITTVVVVVETNTRTC